MIRNVRMNFVSFNIDNNYRCNEAGKSFVFPNKMDGKINAHLLFNLLLTMPSSYILRY